MEVEEDDDDDEDDSDEEDDDDDDEEEEEEEEEAPAKKAGDKRKKDAKAPPPAKKAKVENGDASEGHTIFMGGFADDEAAKKWLKKNGVTFVDVRHTGKACFADLKSDEDVQKATDASDDQHRVEKAKPRGPRPDNNARGGARGGGRGGAAGGSFGSGNDAQTLFVKNLADGVDVKDLQGIFPDSKEIRIPRKPDGAHKGFAFIEFTSASEVDAAMEEKQGSNLNGSSLFLDKMGQRGGGRGGDRGGRGFGRGDRGGRGGRGGFGGGRAPRTDLEGKTKTLFVKNLPFSVDEDG